MATLYSAKTQVKYSTTVSNLEVKVACVYNFYGHQINVDKLKELVLKC